MRLDINLNEIKNVIQSFITELDVEISFNFIMDEGRLLMEMSKGISDMNANSIMNGNKFSYFQGHTHFKKYTKDWKYSPPSATDYTTMFESFYRFYTRKMLIFSKDGVWEVSLDENMIFTMDNDNPSIVQQLQLFQDNVMVLDGYMANDWWESMVQHIFERSNEYLIQLAQPPGEDLPAISLHQYIKGMKTLGFIVKLTPWYEDMIYTVDIDEDDYSFVTYFVKHRSDFDSTTSYLYIDEFDENKLYNKVQSTPEGERVLFDTDHLLGRRKNRKQYRKTYNKRRINSRKTYKK